MAKNRQIYLDAVGCDDRRNHPYGYSLIGERCYILKCGKERKKASWISA